MAHIALLGGTGKTGSIYLQKALKAGHHVTALVRNPEKVENRTNLTALTLIKGDVLNYIDVEKTIAGADVVISLFGHVKNSPELLQTNGTKNIVKAMQKHGVSRIISLSGGGLPFPEKDEPKFADKLIRGIMKVFAKKILDDAIAYHKVLEKSGLDWIIVRGPRLTDDAEQGNYRVGWVGVNASTKIGRADLADFILMQTEKAAFVRQMPFVSY